MMCRKYLAVFLSVFAVSSVSAQALELSAEALARPHSGASLTAWPALRDVVATLDQAPGNRLRISYPGGEEGAQWAYELRAWLIALGIPGQRIELWAGGMTEPGLRLEVQETSGFVESTP